MSFVSTSSFRNGVRRHLYVIVCIMIAIIAVSARAEEAANGPEAGDVTVASVSYSGSACPEGSVNASVSGANSDTLVVRLAGLAGAMTSEKACVLGVQLRIPAGWRLVIGDQVEDEDQFDDVADLQLGHADGESGCTPERPEPIHMVVRAKATDVQASMHEPLRIQLLWTRCKID